MRPSNERDRKVQQFFREPNARDREPKVTFQATTESAPHQKITGITAQETGSEQVPFVARLRNSATNLSKWYGSRDREEAVSSYALDQINRWPTRPQDLGNFLASLDKLRAKGETSAQVIAKASKKLSDILDEVEKKPGIVSGNHEFKLGARIVRQVAWSPNGERLAVASYDSRVRIIDVLSGNTEHTLVHDAEQVRCLQWSFDGNLIATGGADCFARVFCTSTGEEAASFPHGDTVRDVQWCPVPNDLRLATASFDHNAVIFHTLSDREVRLSHADKVRYVRWNPSGTKVATASNEHLTRIFDAWKGVQLLQLSHDNMLEYIDWSIDGTRIATSAHDRNVCIFDATSGERELQLLHGDVVRCLAWSPVGVRLATASRDKYARVYNESGDIHVKWAHHGKLRFLQWSPDGEQLATTAEDGWARVFNVDSGTEQARWKHWGLVEHVHWNPHGQMIATAAQDWCVRLFNVRKGPEELKLRHDDVVRHVQWNHNGDKVATASFDGHVRIFKIPSGNLVHNLDLGDKVRDVQWSPDGQRLAAAADSDVVHVYNVETGREECWWQHPGGVPNVQWSCDSKALATACFDKHARIFNVETRERTLSFPHASSVLHAEWSPDGTKLATLALRENNARIFDIAAARELCVLQHDDWVLAMEWSPKKYEIVTASDDKCVRIFDGQRGVELIRWQHPDVVRVVRWCPYGESLATASSTNTDQHFVSVFERTTTKRKFTLKHLDKIQDVQWSCNAEMLSTASSDKNARIFDTLSGEEVARWMHDGVVRDAMWSPTGQWLGTSSQDGCARIFNAQFAVRVSQHFNRAIVSRRERQHADDMLAVGTTKSLKKDKKFAMKSARSQTKMFPDVTGKKLKDIGSMTHSGSSMSASGTTGTQEGCPLSEVIRLPCGAGRLPLQRAMISQHNSEFGSLDLRGMHLLFDNGGYTLPPHWSMNLSTLHMALYTAITDEQNDESTESSAQGNLGLVLDKLLKCGAREALFYSDLFGLNVLDLALRLKQPAMALDVLVPEVLERMKQDPLQTYRSGFGVSLGRVIGSLTMRGEATALTRITLPQMLEASCFEADPEVFGEYGVTTPPKLASKSHGLRTCGSDTPWVTAKEHKKLLPWSDSGLNVPFVLEVVLLADILSPAVHFFEGICTVPQDDAHELFTHRAVRAFVNYKWNTSAKYRFYLLCVLYSIFLLSFVTWCSLPKDVSDDLVWLKVVTVCLLIPIALVECKQFLISRMEHFEDQWNQIQFVTILLVLVSLADVNEDVNLIVQPFASVLVWVNCLYYLRGFHMTGPYIRTLGAILRDIRGFLIVFVILQIGFAHAMFLSYNSAKRRDIRDSYPDLPDGWGSILLVVVQRTYNLGVLGEVSDTSDYVSPVPCILFYITTITVTVVLLNTLIAAISETFDRLQEHSEASWVQGRAQLINEMELVFGAQAAPPYIVYSRIRTNKSIRSGDEDGCGSKIAMIRRTIAEELEKAETLAQRQRLDLQQHVDTTATNTVERLHRVERSLEQLTSRFMADNTLNTDNVVNNVVKRAETEEPAKSVRVSLPPTPTGSPVIVDTKSDKRISL